MTPLLAYHSDPAIKAKYLRRIRAHAKADRLIQGISWQDGVGCAVGCTLEAYDHQRYPIELGIPLELAYLEDSLFEGLPATDAQAWPVQFLTAIEPGADLSLVWPRFAVWLLREELAPYYTDATRAVSLAVAALYERRISGDEPNRGEWQRAEAAAAEAAEAATAAWVAEAAVMAAWAAGAEAAEMAARAAGAEAAEMAARAAATAAARAAVMARAAGAEAAVMAARAARANGYRRQTAKLTQLLRETRAPGELR